MSGRCGGCAREWSAGGQAHCANCHEQFNSTTAFDRHRLDFACLSLAAFCEPTGKSGKPRLVRLERPNGAVWATEAFTPAETRWRSTAEAQNGVQRPAGGLR